MRKTLFPFLGVLAVFVFPGCDDGTSDNTDRVKSTFAPFITADPSWRDQPGGATLAAMLEEAGLATTPTVLTQLVEGVGSPYGTLLTATFDRPGEVQTQIIEEIQAMEISGLSPFLLGLAGRRDGYLVEVLATTPDGDSGLMFAVLVPAS